MEAEFIGECEARAERSAPDRYPASPFPVFEPRPRELSTNWHETMASATRLSPT
jgi:hypothetical protein